MKIVLRKQDLRRETFRAGGKGGQHQNVTETAVRYTHVPTGIKAESRSERSQHQNDQDAMRVLMARLKRHFLEQIQGDRQAAYEAKPDASFGNQVRTYWRIGQQRVKDHRTGMEGVPDEVIKRGKIDQFITAYLRQTAGL